MLITYVQLHVIQENVIYTSVYNCKKVVSLKSQLKLIKDDKLKTFFKKYGESVAGGIGALSQDHERNMSQAHAWEAVVW